MARVQIDGVGIVEVPDGTNEEVMASARAIRDRYAVAPVDYRAQGLGALVSSGFQRSLEGLKGTALDLLPALGGAIIGADDYAKQQLDEYKERMQKAEEANPTAFRSYKQADSFGNALGYAAETVGEIGPDIAAFVASMLTGSFGAGALARRGTAEAVEGLAEKLAARKGIDLAVAREAVNKQVTGALAEQSAKKLGSRVGLGAASAGINIPDTLQGVYEDTGELRPDLALTIGSLVAALDTYLPSKLLSQLGSAGKAKLAEEMVKKSSVVPTTWKKEFGKALGMTAAGEGITEGTQESLQLFANQLAGSQDPFFSQENIDRIINSAIKGVIGGGVIGAPGAAVEASQVKADRLANIEAQKNQPPPVQPPAQINQPPAGEKSAFETQQPDLLGFYKNLEQKPPQAAPKEVDPLAQRTRELFEEFVSKGMPPAQATRQAYEQARAEQQNDKMYSVESGEVTDPRIANPRQGVLQFAPPAPEPLPKTQIFDQIQAAKKQYEINLANQQAVQEKQAQVEKIAQRAKAQQQLNLAGLLPEQKTFRPPTANGAPAAQQQPDLFGERGRPSRTEGIRQGQTQSLQEDLTYQQPQISTVLDAETLKNTGLKPQSGYYKQLLGLDMANPDDQIKIGQILTAARQNTSMNQAPIESLRNQAFTGLAQQQSLPLTEAPRGTKSPATVSRPNGKSVPVSNRPAPVTRRPAPIKPAGVGVFENVATGLGTGEKVQPSTLKPSVKKELTLMEKATLQAERDLAKKKKKAEEKAELEAKKAEEARKKATEEARKKAEEELKVKQNKIKKKAKEPEATKPETVKGLQTQIKYYNEMAESTVDPKEKAAIIKDINNLKTQLSVLKGAKLETSTGNTSDKLVEHLQAGNITRALNEIATNKTDFSPLENLIANRLLSNKMFRIPNFELVDSKQIDNAAGFFSPIQDKIFVAKNSMDSHTVLHETVHAFLHSYIVEFTSGAVDSARLKDLQAIYDHVLKVAPELAAKYGMKNLSEFASEVMSNKKFQGELKQIPYRRENIFTEFARAVMRLLGLADSDIVNVFGSALISIEGLLNTGRNFQETQVTGRRMDIGDINLDSDAFKKWFGDSKVVDENGKPLIVYHATENFEGSEFKPSPKVNRTGNPDGYYFTYDLKDANNYAGVEEGAQIIPVYLNIKNPYRYGKENKHTSFMIKKFEEELRKDNPNLGDSWVKSKVDTFKEGRFPNITFPTDAMTRVIKAGGYDGMIDGRDWVAFESNQIKSIFNKEPTSSPNIAKLIKEENQQATFRNHPNVPGVTNEDAQSIFDGFIDKIATAPMMNQNRANALHEVLKKGVFGNALTAILSALPVNVLGMEAERVGLKGATNIAKLIDEQSGYINDKNKEIEPLVRRAEAWVKQASPEMVKLFNSVVYGSTTSKADPTKEKTDYPEATQKDKTWSADYDRVKAEYNKLSGSGKKLYVDMRNAYGAMYDEIVRAINERIETFSVDDTIKAKIKSDIMAKLVAQGKIEPYFALTRKGNYWLSYNMRDKSGQVEPYIEAFEYERARTRAVEELKKEHGDKWKDLNIQQFSKLAEYQFARAPSGSFVNKVLQVLEGNKPKAPVNPTAEQKEKYKIALEKYEQNSEEVMRLYISTLPETSFAQSFRKRQNVLGYKEDAVEALRDRLYSTTQQVGRMIYGAKLNKLLADMKILSKEVTRATDSKDNKLINEYIKIFEKHIIANSANNNNVVTKTANLVNTLTFNFQLGFNISSAVVQLAQLPMVVTPYLAGEHNWTDTIKAIGAARRLFVGSGLGNTVQLIGSTEKVTNKAMPSMSNYDFDNAKLPADIRKLKTLYDLAGGEGQLNRSSFYDVLEVDGRKNILNTVNATSGWAFHHADRMNREITLIAAYNLQLDKLNKKGIKGQAAEDAAARYAVDVSKLTNGNVAAGNAPLISKNALGKVLFMYKGYGVSMYYLLFKTTRDALQNQDKDVKKAAMRQIAGIYGSAALFSGLQGIPMFGMAAMIYNLFADDDEDDFETATRKYVGEFMYKGLINEVTGLDVAGRIGLSDLIFRTNPTSQSATFQDAFLQTFGGPAYGAGSKFMRGLSKIQEGNIERGIEDILPSAAGNLLKSFRYGTEGATTMRGDPMIEDFSVFSVGAQALGFTPAELSLQQAINAKTKSIEKAILDEKNKLLQRYNISDREGDIAARDEYKEKLRELNRKHPGLGINEETFKRSRRAFEESSSRMKNGVQYSKKLEQEMLDNIAAYN